MKYKCCEIYVAYVVASELTYREPIYLPRYLPIYEGMHTIPVPPFRVCMQVLLGAQLIEKGGWFFFFGFCTGAEPKR